MNKQMTIRDVAGYCPEEAVWKMIADVSSLLVSEKYDNNLSPSSIMIDGNSFLIRKAQIEYVFLAPENNNQTENEKELVWSLGAIAFYAATGHVVFGGQGSSYQREHPSVALPSLPKKWQTMTPVLQKCLSYNPDERIGLKELNEIAQKGLLECNKQIRLKQNITKQKEIKKEFKYSDESWPEEMVEI